MQTDNYKSEKVFSIHLNSNKPKNFNKFTTSFFNKISNTNFLEIIVHIDNEDDAMKQEIVKLNRNYNNSIMYIETNLIKNFNDAWKPINLLLEKTSKSALYVAVLSDDIIIETDNWDLYYTEKFYEFFIKNWNLDKHKKAFDILEKFYLSDEYFLNYSHSDQTVDDIINKYS